MDFPAAMPPPVKMMQGWRASRAGIEGGAGAGRAPGGGAGAAGPTSSGPLSRSRLRRGRSAGHELATSVAAAVSLCGVAGINRLVSLCPSAEGEKT